MGPKKCLMSETSKLAVAGAVFFTTENNQCTKETLSRLARTTKARTGDRASKSVTMDLKR